MTKEIRDYDVLMKQLTTLLQAIRSCEDEASLQRWSNTTLRESADIIGDIAAGIGSNIEMIDQIGCLCPVCATARGHLAASQDNVLDLGARMSKCNSSQNPLDAMLLLGTTMAMLVTIPDLITAMSDLAQQAHEMGRTLIAGKIVELSVKSPSCDGRGDCSDCSDCGDDPGNPKKSLN
jgi:hypothetical protein